ncbi:WhiB family transcriptional regulator [Streptomyces sp. NPDC001617]
MTTAPAPTGRRRTSAALTDDWMAHGLCRQTDPAIFFPEGRGASITVQTEQAKQVCNQCPVRALCLEWALDTGQHSGTWGGMSEDERRGLREAPDGSQFLLCLGEQEFIEARIAAGGTHREVAEELGVGHHAVGRAWRYFESERKTAEAEQAVKA